MVNINHRGGLFCALRAGSDKKIMNLGSRLRWHRKQQGLTLKAVAEKAGVSEGFMSQVENNVKSPSLDTLLGISAALGVEAGALLSQLSRKEQYFMVPRGEWSEVDVPHTGFATRRFCPPEYRSVLDSALLFIEPGKSIPVRKHIKNSQELLCVLQGRMELELGERVLPLSQGDAIHFWPVAQRQRITNTGDDLAVAIWVGTI